MISNANGQFISTSALKCFDRKRKVDCSPVGEDLALTFPTVDDSGPQQMLNYLPVSNNLG